MAILKCNTNKFSGGQAQIIKYLPRPREKNNFSGHRIRSTLDLF